MSLSIAHGSLDHNPSGIPQGRKGRCVIQIYICWLPCVCLLASPTFTRQCDKDPAQPGNLGMGDKEKKERPLRMTGVVAHFKWSQGWFASLTTYGHHGQKSSEPKGEGSWARPLWLSLPLTWVRLGGIHWPDWGGLFAYSLTGRIRSVYIPSLSVKSFVMLWSQPSAINQTLNLSSVICWLCDFRQLTSPSSVSLYSSLEWR